MSYDNHDQQDPNRVKYEKKEVQLTDEDLLNGRAIKIYTMASTMPLKDFMKWFKANYPN